MLRRIAQALKARRTARRLAVRTPPVSQSGAVPYVMTDDGPVYLLITSRRTGRWIFPKGAIEPDMSAPASAAKEAWEEAGVSGRIEKTPLGVYVTEKVSGRRRRRIAVELYAMEVSDQTGDWPERGSRRRHWATWRQARRLIDNPGLTAVLRGLHQRLTADQTFKADKPR